MKKIGKMYKLKPKAARWLNEHADEIYRLPNGGICDRQSHKFTKTSKEFYVLLVEKSSMNEGTYLALWCSDIGLDCHFIHNEDLGARV